MLDVSFRQKCLENCNTIAERVSQTWTLVGLQGNVGLLLDYRVMLDSFRQKWLWDCSVTAGCVSQK